MSFIRALPVSRVALSARPVRALTARSSPKATRAFSITFARSADAKPEHTADSYFKDVDAEAPADSKVHRVDSSSEAVQRPHDPPSGEYSRAGVRTEEYRSVDKQEPYEAKSDGHQQEKLRYGGKDKGTETSHPGEGPEGASAGGRKPEGRQ